MGQTSWQSGLPRNASDLLQMDWPEFEAFALEVIKAEYRLHGLDVEVTSRGADGGRDGQVEIVVGGQALGAIFTFWIEVKRHSRKLGVKAGGPHLAQAVAEGVDMLVFVSATSITRGLRELCADLAERTGLRHRFLTAKELLELAYSLNGDSKVASKDADPDRRSDENATHYASERSEAAVAREVTSKHMSIIPVEAWFSTSRRLVVGGQRRRLEVTVGTPLFLVVRLSLSDFPVFSRIEFAVESHEPGVAFITIAPAEHRIVLSQDNLTALFAITSDRPASFALSSLEIAIGIWEPSNSSDVVPSHRLKCKLEAGGFHTGQRAEFSAPPLPLLETSSQRAVLRGLSDSVKQWESCGGVRSVTVEAAAGMGKSRLLDLARFDWFSCNFSEIQLDGAVDSTVSNLFYSVFSNLVLADADVVRRVGKHSLMTWFQSVGIEEDKAAKLAEAICSYRPLNEIASPSELAHIMAVLLTRAARIRPIVVVFEDIHKVGGGVLRFMQLLRVALAEAKESVLFVFTGRFEPVNTDVAEHWFEERSRLTRQDDGRLLRIEAPTRQEILSILEHGFKHLYREHADAMIDRAGTSPFELTELVQFLAAIGAIEKEQGTDLWRVAGAQTLRDALRDSRLLSCTPTEARLSLLAERLPDWAQRAIDMAACLGREFDLPSLLFLAETPPDDREVEHTLSRLTRENVWMPVPRGEGARWRFAHDLIHEATLTRLCMQEQTYRRHMLIHKLRNSKSIWPVPIKLALVYLSGDGCEFVNRAKCYSKQLYEEGYPYEAAQYLALEDYVLEQRGPRPQIDNPVFRTAPIPLADFDDPPTKRHTRMIDAKARLIKTLTTISGGGGEMIARLISDVAMLSEQTNDALAKARASRWHGDHAIQSGRNEEAADAYKTAEALYSALSSDQKDETFEATLGRAIALRLTNCDADAFKKLEEARKLAGRDARRQVRYHANYGAMFMYSDTAKRWKHWSRGREIACEAGLSELCVHMRLDLASLDIVEGRYAKAEAAVSELVEETSRRRYEGLLTRALIMEAVLHLLAARAEAALLSLEEARQLGYAHETGRRLWKIHANSATAFELLGKYELMAEEDRRMADMLPLVGWERRRALAPANVVLRTRHFDDTEVLAYRDFDLPSEALNAAEHIVDAVDQGVPLTGQFPHEHLKQIGLHKRFVLV